MTNLLTICSFNIIPDYEPVNQLCETSKTINNKSIYNYKDQKLYQDKFNNWKVSDKIIPPLETAIPLNKMSGQNLKVIPNL